MNQTVSALDGLLHEAGPLLLGLCSNALIGVYVIQDDRFVFVNPRLAELFGYSQQQLCSGMGPRELTAPRDHDMVRREIHRRIEGDSHSSHYAFRGVRQDGSELDVEVFGVSTRFGARPAIIGMLLDVSERTAAERAVQDQLQFITRLIDTIPNPVFYKDETGRYIGCNSAFEQYLGKARSELIGRTVFDISPPDLAARYQAADQALFDDRGTQVYETQVVYGDGSRHEVMFYKATFDKADGSLGGLVGLMLDISERKRMEQAIWHEANYDALTGLPNLRLLRDSLAKELERARRKNSNLALLFIDLDRFKEVNDTLGHLMGDQLLKQAAERIRAVVRSSDTVSRQGGDEFVVILPDISDAQAAALVAGKIIRLLGLPFLLGSNQVYVSASIGIALCPDDSTQLETLVSFADQAMYAAKAAGRNGFSFFTPSLQVEAQRRQQVGNSLRHALRDNHFEAYYQPIIALDSGRAVKAEALLRWRHPEQGVLLPGDFIAVAEEIGMIGDIGNLVFQQTLELLEAWPGGQVSINISPRQFISGDCRHWLQEIAARQLPAGCLAVEITEGLLLDERPLVVNTLLGFHQAGVEVSIDDFGTGYSAMSYLKKFNIDYLKIDRSFIAGLARDNTDHAIAEAVIAMAHKLGMRVIAEGVETEAQRQLLLEAGCDYAQGYLFARPMPRQDFIDFIRSSQCRVAAGGND
ncbi:putative bifunctional diguanylate cyclase/phosphodiesterase [Aquitalea magnusonii]|uniref:Diguanylate cyclase/phosphodiesterase with PAS/PAC sensor(S) n=1 Tax=Aquitalea magnusonii TaxID=332411 RepID=A0A318JR14_9NEIS|nr:EAL domain-containing protein [Aquitalea magnusonii]PXX51223.1 diguanylate cyclase/phosphodiesterase with PAS/PAC sensor(s) [Aquitalea magnusonii]